MFEKDLTQFCFSGLRRVIWLFAGSQRAKNLRIGDIRFKRLFLCFCRRIDSDVNLRLETKRNMKKVALVFCSKLSRDSAYLPLLGLVLEDIRAGRVC